MTQKKGKQMNEQDDTHLDPTWKIAAENCWDRNEICIGCGCQIALCTCGKRSYNKK